MKIADYIEKLRRELGRAPRIGFFGLGVSNSALLHDAVEYECDITLRSDEAIDEGCISALLPSTRAVRVVQGFEDMQEDALFLSPSVRREARAELSDAERSGVRLISDAELFFLDSPSCVYAISGSDGKSTAATLTHALLSEEYPRAALLGNIGIPFSTVPEWASVCVAELSSFQLRYTKPHTKAALITSITENHLDWHESFEEYVSVKLSLLERTEKAVLSADDEVCARYLASHPVYATYSVRRGFDELRSLYSAQLYATAESGYICINGERVLPISSVKRREWYNILNLMGAACLASGHYTRDRLLRVASEFRGLAHRCECFLHLAGKEYIDSSIDTSPARALATLRALDRPVSIILGGRGKHIPLGELCPALKKHAVRIALYGEAGAEYLCELNATGVADITECRYFPLFCDAVEFADGCGTGVAVLLSPAATGYGEFRNYAERGDTFKKYIKDKYKDIRKEV